MNLPISRGFAIVLCIMSTCGVQGCNRSPKTRQKATAELPPPTGPMPIGRTVFHWIDNSRPSVESSNPNAKRELMVYVWYPAKKPSVEMFAPYIPDFATLVETVGESTVKREAGAAYGALSTARTHVFADADVASDAQTFPVLLLSHGLGFNAILYSTLCEDLASQGYVVVGIDHPSTALVVLFPDKRVIPFDARSWNASRSSEESLAFERKSNDACSADLSFVLNQLGKMHSGDSSSPFNGRLDLSRVGALGHSLGGRVALRACQLDKRIKAAVSLDGLARTTHFDTNADGSTVQQPVMIVHQPRKMPPDEILARRNLTREKWEEDERSVRKQFYESVKSGSFDLVVNTPGIDHQSFCDLPLLESGAGDIELLNRRRTMEIIRMYVLAFFNHHVANRPSSLLTEQVDAPTEATLTHYEFVGG